MWSHELRRVKLFGLLVVICFGGRSVLATQPVQNVEFEFLPNQTSVTLGEEITVFINVTLDALASTDIQLDFFNMDTEIDTLIFFYGPLFNDTSTPPPETFSTVPPANENSTTTPAPNFYGHLNSDTSSISISSSQVNRNISLNKPEVYSSLTYNLGTVTNDANIPVKFTIILAAAVAEVSPLIDKIKLGAGISFQYNGTFIAADTVEYEVDWKAPPTPPIYSGGINCSPASLEVDFYTLCEATLETNDSFSSHMSVKVDVENEYELQPNTFSIGSLLEVARKDRHLQIPQEFQRVTSYTPNKDGFSSIALIDLGLVVKPAGPGALVLQFVLSANNFADHAGQSFIVRVTPTILKSNDSQMNASVYVIAPSRSATPLDASKYTIRVLGVNESTSATIPSGSAFVYEVTVDTRGLEGKHEVYLIPEPTHDGVKVCSMIVASSEINTPLVLPPITYIDYIKGSITNTRQVTDPDNGIVKYHLVSQFSGSEEDKAQIQFKLEDGTPVPATGDVVLQGTSHAEMNFKSIEFQKSSNSVIPNRAVGMRLILEFEANVLYPDIKIVVKTKTMEDVDLPLKVCSSFLDNIDISLPCAEVHKDSIITGFKYLRYENDSIYFNMLPNSVDANLGSLSSVSETGKLEFHTVFTMPIGEPGVDAIPSATIIDASEITFEFNVQATERVIWTTSVTLPVNNTTEMPGLVHMDDGDLEAPELYLEPADAVLAVSADAPFLLVAEIKVGAGMTLDLDLLVQPPDGVDLCRLSLRERGQYLSCVQGGDWYRGERFSWMNTSRLFYNESSDVPYARLTIYGLTNIGNQSVNITSNLHNSLLINIPLWIPSGFAGGQVKAVIQDTNSSSTIWQEATYDILAASAGADAPVISSTNLTFTMTPTEYSLNGLNVVEVETQIPKGTAHEVIVSLSGNAAIPICQTHVVFVGELMPCLNGTLATDTISSDGSSVEINLGKVCRLEQSLVDFPDADKVRIRVAFSPLASASSSYKFTADLKYDGVAQNINVQSPLINLGTSKTYPGYATVPPGEFLLNATRIKENNTGVVNISLPMGAAIPVKVKITACPNVVRPSLTISNVNFYSTGKNTQCTATVLKEKIALITSGDYYSTHDDADELDAVEMDLGILVNTGLTSLTYNDAQEDHHISISVDTMLNDALWNDNDAYVGVRAEVTSGLDNNITFGESLMQVIHLDTDIPEMNLTLKVEEPLEVYERMREVKVAFTIGHFLESMAEPAEVKLKMHLPYGNYLSYNRTESVGLKPHEVSLSKDKTILTTKVGQIRFFDTSKVTHYFIVNPDNSKHFGFTEYHLTIPYIFTVKLAQRFNVEGYDVFPNNTASEFPPKVDYFRVNIESPTCSDDIQVSNKTLFPDCLFNASSVLNDNTYPHFARLSSTSPWLPRDSGTKEYLEIDLINSHIVSEIVYKSHPDYLRAKTLIVSASVDRGVWDKSVDVSLPDQSGEIRLKLSSILTGRYLRIYITSKYGTGKAVSLRFDLRGCTISKALKKPPLCGITTLPARRENAGLEGRHFAVDTTLDVAAICDFITDLDENRCFVSREIGNMLSALPHYIGMIHGYNLQTKMLFASDYDMKTYFTSIDGGLSWAPTTETALNVSKLSTSWSSSQDVSHSPAAPIEIQGNWNGDSSGIHKGVELRVAWNTCCRHTLP